MTEYQRGYRDAILERLKPMQLKILEFMKSDKDINDFSLRGMAKILGLDHPQKVKHHLGQLLKVGVVNMEGGQYKLNPKLK